jgi:ubiquinone/menaquinone biosynthesis C-methylase UbiE
VSNNAFFQTSDPRVSVVGGMDLLPSWWSRPWEYAWASQFTGEDLVVADMGAGWSGRPFKELLAERCKEVYAVDLDERLLELPNLHNNLKFVIANFEQPVPVPPVDRIFCISVLEDLTDYEKALAEFKRLLKPDGLIVITCDSKHDPDKPLPKYPGVSFRKLIDAVIDVGLKFDGERVELKVPENAVHHDEWNLACWHGVLKHADA